jgi:hypothetical protein
MHVSSLYLLLYHEFSNRLACMPQIYTLQVNEWSDSSRFTTSNNLDSALPFQLQSIFCTITNTLKYYY